MTALPPSSANTTSTHKHNHVIPLKTYLLVWGALMVLTVLTVVISRFDFGSLNTLIAIFVATVKGSLVALYFMHLRYDNKFNLIILVASLFFVVVFFVPTLIDVSTRGDVTPIRNEIPESSIFYHDPSSVMNPVSQPKPILH